MVSGRSLCACMVAMLLLLGVAGCGPPDPFRAQDWERGPILLISAPPGPRLGLEPTMEALAQERSPQNLANIGWVRYNETNFPEAIAAFEDCLALLGPNPSCRLSSAQCLMGRGLTQLGLERYDEMRTDLQRALVELDKAIAQGQANANRVALTRAFIYERIAVLERDVGDLDAAKAAFQAAIESAEVMGEAGLNRVNRARLGLGVLYGQQGYYEEAAAALELAAASHDVDIRSVASLYAAMAQLSLGDVAAAGKSRGRVRPYTLSRREERLLSRMTPLLRVPVGD